MFIKAIKIKKLKKILFFILLKKKYFKTVKICYIF